MACAATFSPGRCRRGERDGAIFVHEEPKRFVDQLRKKIGKDIWLAGGGELTREFLKEDLVDELYLGSCRC